MAETAAPAQHAGILVTWRESQPAARALWNEAYDVSVIQGQGNLWGDPPVPYAATAAELFRANGAAIVLDLPCGDGRNLPPLAAGAPILLAGDTALKAMAMAEKVARKAGIREKTVFVEVDAFATGLLDDCQPSDPLIKEIAPKEYVDHFDFYCRFYDRADLDALLATVALRAERVEVQSWWEPPHAGYRDYIHQHESLVFTVRKPGR